MSVNSKIRDEKLSYNFNRGAVKISVLSSGEIDKYQHLTGEKIWLSDKNQIVA